MIWTGVKCPKPECYGFLLLDTEFRKQPRRVCQVCGWHTERIGVPGISPIDRGMKDHGRPRSIGDDPYDKVRIRESQRRHKKAY